MIFLRRSQRLFRSLLPAFLLACLLSSSVKAFDQFPYDLALIRALADTNMSDYAMIQVERMIKLYPDRQDMILLHKALVYYSQNRRSKAEEIIDAIGKSSPLYGEASLIRAQEAFKRAQFETAKEAFAAYFSTDPKPRSEAKPDVEAFLKTVFIYAQASVENGDPLGAVKALGEASKVSGELAISEGMLDFQKGKLALDACDKALDQGKNPDPGLVAKLNKKLEEVQFKQIDYLVMVKSLIEVAHGNVILGDIEVAAAKGGDKKAKLAAAKRHYEKAMQTLKSLNELLSAVKDKVPPQDSPLAGAYFYYGRSRKGMGQVAQGYNNRELAVKRLKSALKFFSRIKEEFNGSDYITDAMIEEGKVAKLLESLGEKVDGGGGDTGEAFLAKQEADQYYAAKNFAKAAPLYLQALQVIRGNPRMAPEVGLRLVVCYTNLNQNLESQAIASFLADVFPDAEETAKCLLQLGATPFQKAQKMADGPEKEALMEEAMAAWDQYVEIAPDEINTPDIAFVIAENEYRKASLVAKAARTTQDKAKKEQLKEEARALYEAAIPKYERMTSMFGATPKGVRSYYKLGWIYDSLEMPDKSAEAFLTYARRETLPEYRDDRLEAQFRAGEQLLFSATPLAALEPLSRLLEWVGTGNIQGFDPDSPKAEKVREDASSYIGWAYDLAAEKVRPQITDIKDEKEARQESIKEAETELKRLAAEEKEMETWFADLGKELDEATVDFRQALPTPEADLLKGLMKDAGADQWSDTERELELPKLQARVATEAKKAIERRIQGMQTLKEDFALEREKSVKNFQVSQRELADTDTEIANKKEQLADLEEELEYAAEELAGVLKAYEDAVKGVEEAEAAVEELKTRYERAREAFKTGTPEEKAAAKQEGREVRSLVLAARKRLAKAEEKRAEQDAREALVARRQAQRKKDAAAKQVELTKHQLAMLERRKALLTLDTKLFEQLNKAFSQSLPVADTFVELMNLAPEERYNEANTAAWKAATGKVIPLFAAAKATAEAKLETAKKFFAQDREMLKNSMAQAQKMIADLDEKIKPVQAEFEQLKKKAQEGFNAFLKAYPKSKHVPDNMARLGTIYTEFNQFDLAEKSLKELAEKYPGHKAVKQAMFSLGKVQVEIGKLDEAAKAFEQVLENPGGQAAGNLKYIVRATMDSAAAELGLKASRELLARSDDVNHEDYDKLSGRAREVLLFRAGKCGLAAKKYKDAAAYFTQLLSENEKTARYFDAKISLGEAYRLMEPPQRSAAIKALSDAVKFSQDRAVTIRALLEMVKVELGRETPGEALMALGRLGQLVIVLEGEVEVLADDSDPEIRPMLEEAFYLAAKCSAISGNTADKELLVKEYQKRFPNGNYRREMTDLPGN